MILGWFPIYRKIMKYAILRGSTLVMIASVQHLFSHRAPHIPQKYSNITTPPKKWCSNPKQSTNRDAVRLWDPGPSGNWRPLTISMLWFGRFVLHGHGHYLGQWHTSMEQPWSNHGATIETPWKITEDHGRYGRANDGTWRANGGNMRFLSMLNRTRRLAANQSILYTSSFGWLLVPNPKALGWVYRGYWSYFA